MIIFVNDNFIEQSKANISISDRGLLLADGIFTTLKVIKSKILHFDNHYERLLNNSHIIKLPFTYSKLVLSKICTTLIELNNFKNETCIIRISLTRGISKRGIDIPTDCIPSILVNIIKSSNENLNPISLFISSYTRNEYSPVIHVKSLNYLESILARQAGKDLGYNDSIMCNTKGNICETTVANIFFMKSKQIFTPKLSDGILPGITRKFVIHILRINNFKVNEISLNEKDIYKFDGCFITNCCIGIQEVYKINEKVYKKSSLLRLIKMIYNKQI